MNVRQLLSETLDAWTFYGEVGTGHVLWVEVLLSVEEGTPLRDRGKKTF